MALSRREQVQGFWRVGDTVYIATSEQQLHAINAAMGTLRWSADLGPYTQRLFRPVEVNDGKFLLVASASRLYLLSKQSGETVNTGALPFAATTDPIVSNNAVPASTLVMGGTDEFTYGMFMDYLGHVKWKNKAKADDTFVSTPAFSYGHQVITASKHGYLWALNVNDGDYLWAHRKVNGDVVAGSGG